VVIAMSEHAARLTRLIPDLNLARVEAVMREHAGAIEDLDRVDFEAEARKAASRIDEMNEANGT